MEAEVRGHLAVLARLRAACPALIPHSQSSTHPLHPSTPAWHRPLAFRSRPFPSRLLARAYRFVYTRAPHLFSPRCPCVFSHDTSRLKFILYHAALAGPHASIVPTQPDPSALVSPASEFTIIPLILPPALA